jgi:hypothetical protein
MPVAPPHGSSPDAPSGAPANTLPANAPSPSAHRQRGTQALLSALVAVTLAWLVVRHTPGTNGTPYWKWDWIVRPAARWYPWMLLAASPIAIAVAIAPPARAATLRRVAALFLLMVAVAAMKIMSLACVYPGLALTHFGDVVYNFQATSYYTDAGAIASADPGWAWLGNFHQILPLLHLHSLSKPPGQIAYHMLFIRALGYSHPSATVAGVVLAALAALSIPATYWLINVLANDRTAALVAAIMLTLCPGFILFCPSFDAVYVALAAILLASWHQALSRDGRAALVYSIAAGVSASLLFFLSYSPLVLGFFMIGDSFLSWWKAPHTLTTPAHSAPPLAAIAARALSAIAVTALLYGVLYLLTGFDPIATFRVALNNQRALLAIHGSERPYPRTIPFDLTDFVFSAAWIVLIPATIAVARAIHRILARHTPTPPLTWLLLLAIAQPILVAATGDLQAETARVWNFMLPLLLLPAAIELTAWPPWARRLFYASMLLILLVVGQNMTFLGPPPVIRH